MKTDLFQSGGHCWVFQICWHNECSTFTASSFKTWNSTTGIPSPLLALFLVMEASLRATWLCIPRCVALGEWSHHCDYLGHEDLLYSSSVYSCYLFLISSACVRSIPFLSFIVPIFAWNILLVSLSFPPFLYIDYWGRLSYLSLLLFGILHSNRYIFAFRFSSFHSYL